MQTSLKKWLSVGAATAMAVLGTSVALPSAAFADDSSQPSTEDCNVSTFGLPKALKKSFDQVKTNAYKNQVWINYNQRDLKPTKSLFPNEENLDAKEPESLQAGNMGDTRGVVIKYKDGDSTKDLATHLDATLVMNPNMVKCIMKAWPYLDKDVTKTYFKMYYTIENADLVDDKARVTFSSGMFDPVSIKPKDGVEQSVTPSGGVSTTFSLPPKTKSFMLTAKLKDDADAPANPGDTVTLTIPDSSYSITKETIDSFINKGKAVTFDGHIMFKVSPNEKAKKLISVYRFVDPSFNIEPADTEIKAYDPIKITFVRPIPKPDLPQIQPHDQVACVGQTFNALEGVTAKDKADGDLTKSVTADLKNVDLSKPGTYTVVYSVTNSHKLTNNRTAKVTVKKCGPQKPTAKPAASGKTAVPAKPATAKPELARTGSATLTLSIASFAMLILGGSVLTLRRRRLS